MTCVLRNILLPRVDYAYVIMSTDMKVLVERVKFCIEIICSYFGNDGVLKKEIRSLDTWTNGGQKARNANLFHFFLELKSCCGTAKQCRPIQRSSTEQGTPTHRSWNSSHWQRISKPVELCGSTWWFCKTEIHKWIQMMLSRNAKFICWTSRFAKN